MKQWMVFMPLTLGLTLLSQTGCVAPGPPLPPGSVVEYVEPAPYAGAVWVGGNWGWHAEHRRYEWHHGYWH